MQKTDSIPAKIFTLPQLLQQAARWRFAGKRIVFTNGCFDILHKGHIFSLSQAAAEGHCLVVGVNADASVKRLKGPERPINDQEARSLVLAALVMVDAVVVFEEDTPLELITTLQPDVLVKGGDYTIEQIVGAKEVMARGGRVVINPILQGYSTTEIIGKLKGEVGQ
jgi:D-glycero-beta-D-manno-heptose 1-phosphate adenylyltransferase